LAKGIISIIRSSIHIIIIITTIKADGITWLLYKLAGVSSTVTNYLLQRELLGQLTDIFLGESSPLSDSIYEVGTRKKTPSSYTFVGPPKKSSTNEFQLPAAAKNIPGTIISLIITLSSLLIINNH